MGTTANLVRHCSGSRFRHAKLCTASVTAFFIALCGVPGSLTAQTTTVDSAPAVVPSTAPLPGADLALDEQVKRIASRLRCPVCQGESIQDSPAELAMQMKQLVREQLWEGKSEDQVLDYFIARYGQWIMLEPRAEGFNLIVYWLPVLFLIFGGAAIWMAVKRWTVKPAPPSA